MKLANNIKNLREKNNLTQNEFGKLINVTGSAISKWERGINMPDVISLQVISKIFNITVDELTGEDKIKYSLDINSLKSSISNTLPIKSKNRFVFIVPIINIILLISIIVSLLVILIPTYKDNITTQNDGRLIYSNIESVSLKIMIPGEDSYLYKMNKISSSDKQCYVLNNIYVLTHNESKTQPNLATTFSIIIKYYDGTNIDIARMGRLTLSIDNKVFLYSNSILYPYIDKSNMYNFKFYIENEIGYLGAYLSQ